MAILLTTEYQEIARFSLDYGDVITYGKYTQQDREANTTTYWVKSVYSNPNYNISFDYMNFLKQYNIMKMVLLL